MLTHSLAAFAEIERIERITSFHDPLSELSRLNREAASRTVKVGREMARALAYGLRLSRLTDGVFDFTVAASELVRTGSLPDHGPTADREATWRDIRMEDDRIRFRKPLLIDLGGIAKGYAVDRAMAVLPPDLDASVNAGGDLRLQPWRGRTVAIKVPSKANRRRLLEVPMRACSVATSASYYGTKLVCPVRRREIADPRSVSVFAETCMQADALTKVAQLVPGQASLWRQVASAALIVDDKARCHWLGEPT